MSFPQYFSLISTGYVNKYEKRCTNMAPIFVIDFNYRTNSEPNWPTVFVEQLRNMVNYQRYRQTHAQP